MIEDIWQRCGGAVRSRCIRNSFSGSKISTTPRRDRGAPPHLWYMETYALRTFFIYSLRPNEKPWYRVREKFSFFLLRIAFLTKYFTTVYSAFYEKEKIQSKMIFSNVDLSVWPNCEVNYRIRHPRLYGVLLQHWSPPAAKPLENFFNKYGCVLTNTVNVENRP